MYTSRPFLFRRSLTTATSPRTVWLGWAVSLCVHALALAWRFEVAVPPQAVLDVVLVNAARVVVPDASSEAPRLLAQLASRGGGQARAGEVATTWLPYTGDAELPWLQDELHQQQLQLEAAQREVLARLQGPRDDDTVLAPREQALAWRQRAAAGRDDREQDAWLANPQLAALAERMRAYDRAPRTHFFAPSTSPAPYAQYVEAWRRTVEAVGTQHYPSQARGRVYGSLRMTVLLAADGNVLALEIDQPSEHALLNQAARRIVQLAAPFAPLPPELVREAGQLSITRTWHFVNDQLRTSASGAAVADPAVNVVTDSVTDSVTDFVTDFATTAP